MDKNEERAIAKLLEAYTSSKPIIDEIADEQEYVSNVLGLFIYACKHAPGNEEAFQNLSRVSNHINKMFSVLTMIHGTARSISAIMSEHQDSSECEHEESNEQNRRTK